MPPISNSSQQLTSGEGVGSTLSPPRHITPTTSPSPGMRRLFQREGRECAACYSLMRIEKQETSGWAPLLRALSKAIILARAKLLCEKRTTKMRLCHIICSNGAKSRMSLECRYRLQKSSMARRIKKGPTRTTKA